MYFIFILNSCLGSWVQNVYNIVTNFKYTNIYIFLMQNDNEFILFIMAKRIIKVVNNIVFD